MSGVASTLRKQVRTQVFAVTSNQYRQTCPDVTRISTMSCKARRSRSGTRLLLKTIKRSAIRKRSGSAPDPCASELPGSQLSSPTSPPGELAGPLPGLPPSPLLSVPTPSLARLLSDRGERQRAMRRSSNAESSERVGASTLGYPPAHPLEKLESSRRSAASGGRLRWLPPPCRLSRHWPRERSLPRTISPNSRR